MNKKEIYKLLFRLDGKLVKLTFQAAENKTAIKTGIMDILIDEDNNDNIFIKLNVKRDDGRWDVSYFTPYAITNIELQS